MNIGDILIARRNYLAEPDYGIFPYFEQDKKYTIIAVNDYLGTKMATVVNEQGEKIPWELKQYEIDIQFFT